jgi:hypothetical protein
MVDIRKEEFQEIFKELPDDFFPGRVVSGFFSFFFSGCVYLLAHGVLIIIQVFSFFNLFTHLVAIAVFPVENGNIQKNSLFGQEVPPPVAGELKPRRGRLFARRALLPKSYEL